METTVELPPNAPQLLSPIPHLENANNVIETVKHVMDLVIPTVKNANMEGNSKINININLFNHSKIIFFLHRLIEYISRLCVDTCPEG